jgi:hypothetical protein
MVQLDCWVVWVGRWVVRGRFRRWMVPGLGVAALLVMVEISQLLATLDSRHASAYSMGALTGLAGFPPWTENHISEAITHWAAVAHDLNLTGAVLWWIRLHLLLDALIFVPAYTIGLGLLLCAVKHRYPDQTPGLWPGLMAVVVFFLDEAETFLTLPVVHGLKAPKDPLAPLPWGKDGFLTWLVASLTFAKWIVLATILALAALRALRGSKVLSAPSAGEVAAGHQPGRVLSRHRTQLGVLIVFAGLVAVPAGGPLAQLPDILRAWTDGSGIPIGDIAGPILAVAVLCLALWVAGRWALLDGDGVPVAGAAAERASPRAACSLFIAAVVSLVVAVVLSICLGWAAGGIFAVPLVLWVLVVVGWVEGLAPWRHTGRPDTAPAPDDSVRLVDAPRDTANQPRRQRVRAAGRVLAALPVAVLGLGLIRAFAGPLLLSGTSSAFPPWDWEVIGWFGVGLALVLVGAPLVALAMGRVEDSWLGDATRGGPAGPADAATRLPNRLGAVLFLALLLLSLIVAVAPLSWGPRLRSIGVLGVLLAAITFAGAWLTRRAELRQPLYALQPPFHRTPVWLLVLVIFVLAGRLDTTGGHHDVRLADPPATASATPQPGLRDAFSGWVGQMAHCQRTRDLQQRAGGSAGQARAVPLLLVAAAGGGIRAAYWTGITTDTLHDAGSCSGRALFAASGVSGGALGLAGASAAHAKLEPASGSSGPTYSSGRNAAGAQTGEGPLAATLAAMLYRDLPRGFHNINGVFWPGHSGVVGHDDRAGVLERAWEARDSRLTADFYQNLPPELDPKSKPRRLNPGSEWRPLLLFSGTEVASGCRVLVSPLRGVGHTASSPPRDCREPAVTPTTSTVHDAATASAVDQDQFAAGTLDARDYLDRRPCNHAQNRSLTVATAAHLAARFAFVSPTGALWHCSTSGKDPTPAYDIDGGYLENSGLAPLLELWADLEPIVAEHNASVAAGKPAFGVSTYVVPLLALLDNHYTSVAPVPPPARPRELIAPLTGRSASSTAVSWRVLEQLALLDFSGPLPGLPGRRVKANKRPCRDERSFYVAPRRRPGVEAPLGWVLSKVSKTNLEGNLQELAHEDRDCAH